MHALATGECIAHEENRWVWITEDLADAFEHVSQNRLLQILRKLLPDDRLAAFLTHMIENGIAAGNRLAFTQSCTYPDGAKVFCSAMLDLKSGKIAQQTVVQAWDG